MIDTLKEDKKVHWSAVNDVCERIRSQWYYSGQAKVTEKDYMLKFIIKKLKLYIKLVPETVP